jgi:hypothetical protein
VRTLFKTREEDAPDQTSIRKRRVEVARRNSRWTELEETALVRRARYLVHADTDELFTVHRGVVFGSGSASVIADQSALYFCVRPDGELVFLERQTGRTWSDIVRRQAKRKATA